jgi:hypothetical protein
MPPTLRIRVDGDERTAARLTRLGLQAMAQAPVMAAQARAAARDIGGIPRDTGRLEASVRVGYRADSDGFRVVSNVPYAHFVFGGTSRMAARPPQVPESAIGADTADAVMGSLRR